MNTDYAMKKGRLIHISDVESGLKCECVCPGCGEKMIARKGKKMAHHFAHYNTVCTYGLESTLHLMAKDILEQEKKILLPKVPLGFSCKPYEFVAEQTMVELDKVILEKQFDEFIPDILAEKGNKLLAIEIWVSHRIDEIKLEKIKKAGISVLEINLSKVDRVITAENLRNILVGESEYKNWAYNRLSEYYRQKWLSICEVKEIVERGHAIHVDYCPIPARVWRGKPYANMLDDCLSCKFFIHAVPHYNPEKNDEFGNNKLLYCSGKAKIGSIYDLKKRID